MHKLMADTCVWMDLAKEPAAVPDAACTHPTGRGEITLLVPRTVLDEFKRNKDRLIEHNTRSVSSTLKRVKELVGKFGDENAKQVVLEQINLVDQKLPRLGDGITTAVTNIEMLLERGEIVEITDAVTLRAAQRALEVKAPFHGKRNSMADAIILETFADCVTGPQSVGHTFAFVTHNVNDFSAQGDNNKHPHPDIASVFTPRKVKYYTSLAEALNAVHPDLVEEFAFDITGQPRRTDEILEAVDLLWHQVWYNRHMVRRQRIEMGREAPSSSDIERVALEAEERVRAKYGEENLGPWDDFEWGMINGKLSALNWVLGEEWDMLDT